MTRHLPCFASLLATLAFSAAGADTLVLTTSSDNTLIEDPNGSFSAGAAQNFYVGRVGVNGEGFRRRGVIRFDVSSIPPGSVVTAVSLKLTCTKAGSGISSAIALKRLTAPFGEGNSVAFGGGGAPSAAGDATWLHSSYPGSFWAAPGGDFVATVSSTKSVTSPGAYVWPTTPQFVADVQAFVDAPATNFGWVVQGNETSLQSVKRFDSRESDPATRPQLTISYVVPVVVEGDLNGDQHVDAADLALLLGQWGGPGSADFDGSGAVGPSDLAVLLGAWTG